MRNTKCGRSQCGRADAPHRGPTRAGNRILWLLVSLAATLGPAAAESPAKSPWVNVAPFATVTSNPYCGTLQYLTDGEVPAVKGAKLTDKGPFLEDVEVASSGEIATFARFPIRATAPSGFTFTFEAPVTVREVRFFQSGLLRASYKVQGDAEGDGRFESLLVHRVKIAAPKSWETARFEPTRVRALRFTILEAQKRLPAFGEFQIIGKADEIRKAPAGAQKLSRSRLLRFGKPVRVSASKLPREKRLRIGAVCSLWMWLNIADPPAKGGINRGALKSMKEIGLDRVRLFMYLKPKDRTKITYPKDEKYRSRMFPIPAKHAGKCMPFPSEVLAGYKENVLERFAEDLRKEGLELTVIPPRNVPPFDPRSGYYPMAQSDHHEKAQARFPCVTHGDYFKPAFRTILKEIAASAVTGVDVVPDEFYVENHSLARMPADDPCRALFKERYGFDVPAKAADTEPYRKWLLFQMESTAELFKSFVEAAKEANADVVTETNFSVVPILHFNRPAFGLAIDLVGHIAGVDVLGTDPYFRADTLGHYQIPKTSCIYKGATPNRTVCMMLQAVCGDFRTPLTDPVWAAGNATSAVMRGVRNIDLYRLNYFAHIGKAEKPHPTTPIYKNWVAMIRRLEALGLKEAHVPRKIAFLYNRAGEDWWELREKLKTPTPHDYPPSAMAGHIHHDAMMKMLFANGYPFELFFLDQPSTLKNATDFKVLVIPFAYSISRQAKAIIEDALAEGARVLVVKGRGETDEFGTPYDKPALAGWDKRKGVILLDEDLVAHGTDPAVEKRILSALWALLGSDRPIIVNNFGRDVEVGLLEHPNGTRFVFAVNWDRRPSPVALGLNLPEGDYRVDRYDLEGVRAASLNGKQTIAAGQLTKFGLEMKGHETLVLVIRKVGG